MDKGPPKSVAASPLSMAVEGKEPKIDAAVLKHVGVEPGSPEFEELSEAVKAVGGITDWLVPGVSGECAAGKPTAAALSSAIVRALRDPDHYAALRRGAWETACRFTVARHMNVLERVLNRAAAEGACR